MSTASILKNRIIDYINNKLKPLDYYKIGLTNNSTPILEKSLFLENTPHLVWIPPNEKDVVPVDVDSYAKHVNDGGKNTGNPFTPSYDNRGFKYEGLEPQVTPYCVKYNYQNFWKDLKNGEYIYIGPSVNKCTFTVHSTLTVAAKKTLLDTTTITEKDSNNNPSPNNGIYYNPFQDQATNPNKEFNSTALEIILEVYRNGKILDKEMSAIGLPDIDARDYSSISMSIKFTESLNTNDIISFHIRRPPTQTCPGFPFDISSSSSQNKLLGRAISLWILNFNISINPYINIKEI